jgi:hypothetical protein
VGPKEVTWSAMKQIVASVLMTLVFAIVCPGIDVVANGANRCHLHEHG